jgi:putative spermidine/putrescine transport system ATP-binding protein
MADLELRQVTKQFGTFLAVKDFSIDVERGEFVSFLGPSGCGKTTTLRMIAGFIEPSSGDILIRGQKVNGVPPYRRDTGMVFQNYALFPHMTVYDNIAFGLRYRKVPKDEIKKRVREMLELVRLPDVEGRKPSQLSGGQQQRIALARAMVIKPKVLLFDEPLSNLDAKLREKLRVELRQIQQEVGITSIFVTHDQEEALALSDRIVVMNQGEVTQIGTPFEIYEKPSTEFVGGFIGQSNFLSGTVAAVASDSLTIQLADGISVGAQKAASVNPGDKVKVLIRAERIDLKIQPNTAHLASETNVIKGTIENFSYLGGNAHYYLKLENGQSVFVIEQTAGKTMFERGDTTFLVFGFHNCLYFPLPN